MIKVIILHNVKPWGEDCSAFSWEGICTASLEAANFSVKEKIEVTLTLTDDATICVLNKKHRGKDKATNVLSFPAYDPAEPHPPGAPINLGDIVLAFETIEREAEAQNKSFEDHVTHLVVHGVLHLIGHDHIADDEAEKMEALEIRILDGLGVKNPYETQ